MVDFRKAWSSEIHSGNRSDSDEFLERKAKEHRSVLVDYCNYIYGQSIVDLGCGAGELLASLASFMTITTAVDYSQSMMGRCRQLLASKNITDIATIISDISILPSLSHKYWVSTGALSQYSDMYQLELIFQSFIRNKDVTHIVFFDTIDPILYLVRVFGLTSYFNLKQECRDTESLSTNRRAKISSSFKQILHSLASILLLRAIFYNKPIKIPGSIMGYAVSPAVWNSLCKKYNLNLTQVSSREFEYRYHVIISKLTSTY